jgi:hypothetical protein
MAKPKTKTDPAIKEPPAGTEQPKAPVTEPGKVEPKVTKPRGDLHHGGVVKMDRKPERVPHAISGDLRPPRE